MLSEQLFGANPVLIPKCKLHIVIREIRPRRSALEADLDAAAFASDASRVSLTAPPFFSLAW
jgi:hypothetical protein